MSGSEKPFELEGLPSIEEGRKLYQQNDFIMQVGNFKHLAEDERTKHIYRLAETSFREIWHIKLKSMGMKDSPQNFSNDDPLILLRNQDIQYIAGKTAEALRREEEIQKMFDLFFTVCEDALNTLYSQYAKEHNKDIEALEVKEILDITYKVVEAYTSELTSYFMQVQSVPEIIDVLQSNRAAEDFNESILENHDKIDFERKWNHSRTKIGPMMSYEELCDGEDGNESKRNAIEHEIWIASGGRNEDEEEFNYHVLREDLISCAGDDKDVQIVQMLDDGMTHAEIAKRLGFSNHSAVVKRIKKLKEKYIEKYNTKS